MEEDIRCTTRREANHEEIYLHNLCTVIEKETTEDANIWDI